MQIKSLTKIIILLAFAQTFCACASDNQVKPKVQEAKPAQTTALPANPKLSDNQLKITIMDVNHGDAILLQTNKKNYLIDTGHYKNKELYASQMAKLGVTQVDTLLLTHHHKDHVGNALWSAGKYKIHRIWDTGIANPKYKDSDKLHNLLAKGNYKNKVLKAGDRFDLENKLHFEVFAPGSYQPTFKDTDLNNKSLVMKMSFGDFTMLFTGDIEAAAEEAIVNKYGKALRADVVKVPHHGSKSSSTWRFITQVKPKYALISCGPKEYRNHPNPKVVGAWEHAGAKVFYTAANGNLTVLTDGKNYSVTTEK